MSGYSEYRYKSLQMDFRAASRTIDEQQQEIERLQAEVTHQKNVISRYRRLASGKAALLAQHGIQETGGE